MNFDFNENHCFNLRNNCLPKLLYKVFSITVNLNCYSFYLKKQMR